MPNWCCNILEVSGHPKTLKKFKEQTQGRPDPNKPEAPRAPLSFNALCPMPEELNVESGSHGSIGYAAFYGKPNEVQKVLEYPWVKDAGVTNQEELQVFLDGKDPEYRATAEQWRRNRALYDFDNWYDWRLAYWGTKWDLDQDCRLKELRSRLVYSFETAWAPPLEWLEVVAEKFPSLVFTLSYEEGGMGFTGKVRRRGTRLLQNLEAEMWAGEPDEEYTDGPESPYPQYYGFVSDPAQSKLEKA
jgi:hypothetical protein